MLIASFAAQRPAMPLDPAADISALALGEDAMPEAVRKAPEHRDDAIDVDEVDPDLVAAHRGTVEAAYSTVTDFARLRGWSTSVPRATATS